MRLLYTVLWWLCMPLVLIRLWRRGAKEWGYRQHIGERLGFYRHFKEIVGLAPLIWIHAVSVGETRAAQPLIKGLLEAYPKHRILLTHMTATGRQTGQQLFSNHGVRVMQCYFPYDTGWMCKRFLRYFKPQLCILMETEVWPNMIHQCGRHHVPVMLANARLSERSLRRGQRFGPLLRDTASGISCVAAQSEADARRLVQFGARNVHVTGSIKFDVQPPQEMVKLGQRWHAHFGSRKVLLCASTREGEEELILDAFCQLPHRDFLLLLVPRHPQRFDEVEVLIKSHGLRIQRRSTGISTPIDTTTDIVLGDSMGEMFAYYAASDIAFIGGSLLPLGGQNLIEACALNKPVLIGPHTFNFQVITEDAIAGHAALRVANAAEMLQSAQEILNSPDLHTDMAQNAGNFSRQHQGATLRTISLVAQLID